MRKLFHFASPREHYTADAVVVWCFDHRFNPALRKFLQKTGVEHVDLIVVAGGAKNLASPQNENDRRFVLDQIKSSTQLHQTKTVFLMLHSDCGAYGGLGTFDNDPARESENHNREMQKAMACLKKELPELKVRAFLIDFEGVWEIDLSSREVAAR